MLATWWQGDPIPELSRLNGLEVRVVESAWVFAAFDIPVAEAARRMAEGHRAYVASYRREPAAYGWVDVTVHEALDA